MTDTVQKLAPRILEEIKKANNILLHCHPSPDPDSIGGALAMMQVLEKMDKKVTLIKGDSDIPLVFSLLPGYDRIVKKNIFEVDLNSFDLFLIQDSGSIEQISKIGNAVFPDKLVTIAIDHHATNNNFAKINLVDATYPANCQIIYDLFKIWNVDITPDIARCLILGIYSDTGAFKYPSTTGDTLAAAADLAHIAPDYTSLIFSMENSNTPGAIAYEALALSSISLHFHDHVAISAVSYDALKQKGIEKKDVHHDIIANILKSVVGWNIGIRMVEDTPGAIRVSFRTRDAKSYDVSKIALAVGGGGHKAAAGAYMQNISLDEAVKKVVEAINTIYPNLGK